jgi:hypothetical protein
MLLAQINLSNPLLNKIFYAGWGLVFTIACIGMSIELIVGDICPKSNDGIPLCYVSFGFCIAIISLRLILTRFGQAWSK